MFVEMMEKELLNLTESLLAKSATENNRQHESDILDSSKFDLKLDKSNILMLGPTGSGEYEELFVRVSAVSFYFTIFTKHFCLCPAVSIRRFSGQF